MKNFLTEKVIIGLSILGSLFGSVPKDSTSTKEANQPIKIGYITQQNTVIASNKVDSILTEAKLTIANYNKTVEERSMNNKRIISLTRKEIKNTKETTKIINSLSSKNKLAKYSAEDNRTLSELKVDSTCTTYRKPLFGARKCSQWTYTYYIYKGSERINLQ